MYCVLILFKVFDSIFFESCSDFAIRYVTFPLRSPLFLQHPPLVIGPYQKLRWFMNSVICASVWSVVKFSLHIIWIGRKLASCERCSRCLDLGCKEILFWKTTNPSPLTPLYSLLVMLVYFDKFLIEVPYFVFIA